MCLLDISTTNESPTAENGSTHNKLQIMIGMFKKYLLTVLPIQKWLKRTAPLKVGQIVFILKDLTPRSLWPFARISAIDNKDTQQPGQYEVKTKTGTFKKPAICHAPIQAEKRLHADSN